MKLFLNLVFLTVLFLFPLKGHAQADSTTIELPDSIREKEHSPTKATIMSACLPGLGQLYNRKYWKIPIVYAGLGIMTYFIVFNATEYLNFKCAYIESVGGSKNGNYAYLTTKYNKDELLSAREYYQRNLEISCLITAVWYALQILDATVDAHLSTFNITDRLAVKIGPAFQSFGYNGQTSAGFKLSLNF
jgi:hypothetical protein